MTAVPTKRPAPKRARPQEPERRQTGQPVWRDSRLAGRHVRPQPLTWEQKHRLERVLDQLGRDTRIKGRRRGCKGTIALVDEKVHAELARLQLQCGEAFPSYEWIAGKVGCAVRTAFNAVQRLVEFGALDYVRRYEPTDGQGARGPQVRQISNYYWVRMPKAAQALLERWLKAKRERGDDGVQADREARRRTWDAAEAADREERARTLFDSPAMRRAEAKRQREAAPGAGGVLDERDCTQGNASAIKGDQK